MRIARKLVLVALAAIAASAMAASTASAQVEITNEAGAHCAPVVLSGNTASGGCQIDASSDNPIALEAFGALVSACDNAYDATVDEDGHGYIYNQSLTGADCTTPPCASGTGTSPWEIEVSEVAAGTRLEAQFCVQSSSLGTVNCHLPNVVVDTTTHQPAFTLASLPCEGGLGFIHVTGTYSTTNGGMEITH